MPKRKAKTINQVIATLLRWKQHIVYSYTDIIGPNKGKVTDKDAIWDIECLDQAIRLVKKVDE